MQCIIMEKHLIKLTHHDATKKRAHDSQIVIQWGSCLVNLFEVVKNKLWHDQNVLLLSHGQGLESELTP